MGTAHADGDDESIIGRQERSHVDDVELRTTYLSQTGHGFQSQDGTVGEAGSEAMFIIEPWVLFHVRQSEKITHEVMIPVDIITAASPDAVDTTTSASRRNEAADFDVRTKIKATDVDTITTRVTAHGEEPLASGTLGGGYVRSLADDNATLGASANFTGDYFDIRDHFGKFHGKTGRFGANANVTASQILSPTTVVDGEYGLTYQVGTLDPSGWNVVPTDMGKDIDEKLPRTRVRSAASARIAQHIPWTHSTLKAMYRYYVDDFGIHAHSVEFAAYQYIVPWLYVRGGYRFHRQTAADFFTTNLPIAEEMTTSHTADSDLAKFDSTEWSVEVALVRGRAPSGLRPWSFSAEVMRYTRTNDLQITAVSLSIGKAL